MSNEVILFRRAELYEQVWAEPVRTVAKRHGISDVGLAKICRRLSVPVPGRGYWAAKEAGRTRARPPLPQLPRGATTEVQVSRVRPDAGSAVNATVTARVKEEKRGSTIQVAHVLSDPHPLVARTAKGLRGAKPVDGLVSTHSRRCLDIVVSPATVDRALRIADALVKALAARNLHVEVAAAAPTNEGQSRVYSRQAPPPPAPRQVSRVRVNEEWIEWGITERRRSEMGPPPTPPKSLPRAQHESWLRWNRPRPVLVPNGVLVLEIHGADWLGTRRTWKDGKRQRVEGCLNDFIAQLFSTADAMKRRRAAVERQRQEWQDEERRRHEAEKRDAEDARNEMAMKDIIGRWRLARDLREYLGEVDAAVSEAGMELSPDTGLGRLLVWASDYAARIDPIESLRAAMARVKEGAVEGSDGEDADPDGEQTRSEREST